MPVRLAAALLALAWTLLAALGCALGDDEEGGCRGDAECPAGFTCRAGACFRITTDLSPPADDVDAGADASGG